MIKLIRRKLYDAIRWINRAEYDGLAMEKANLAIGDSIDRNINSKKAIYFRVHYAVGGYVIEYTSVNSMHGREETEMYIVGEGQDLSDAVSKIITIESLRR
jgi:hypothetical protein